MIFYLAMAMVVVLELDGEPMLCTPAQEIRWHYAEEPRALEVSGCPPGRVICRPLGEVRYHLADQQIHVGPCQDLLLLRDSFEGAS